MPNDPTSVDGARETARFARVGFEQFRALALDPSLSEAEKMGFARGHREGLDDIVWDAIVALLPRLSSPGARVLEIGPGCGGLARRMIALAEAKGHDVAMVDHAEMLAQLPESPRVRRVAGCFPDALASVEPDVQFDVILAYSVLQSILVDANPFGFLDAGVARLAPGGRFLVGDIPNDSKLRRFLNTPAGDAFHRAYMRTETAPDLPPFAPAADRADDSLVLGLLMRARLAGCDAYVLPQAEGLPFANRREDLLVVRP